MFFRIVTIVVFILINVLISGFRIGGIELRNISYAYAAVTAFDSITTLEKPIMLKAQTKGKFFPQGGRLVDFFIKDKYLGRTLSGGDGYAFLEYLPQSPGLKKIEVRAGDDRDIGSILVMIRNEKVILIQIEGGLFESIFSDKPRDDSKEAIEAILKKHRIVYITTMLGIKLSRKWLEDNHIPSSVILRWTRIGTLEEINQLGIKVYAIVGSPDVVGETSEYIKKRYCFEDIEDGVKVKDWKELLKSLK